MLAHQVLSQVGRETDLGDSAAFLNQFDHPLVVVDVAIDVLRVIQTVICTRVGSCERSRRLDILAGREG